MKGQISKFAAALGLCLLLGVGSAAAHPAEPCEYDGQIGHTFEHDGWHVWHCSAGNWQYVGHCGDFICIM